MSSNDMSTWFERLQAPPPASPGTRIRLVAMDNDPDPIPPGSEGTVSGGNGAQMWVRWDSGRTLMLLVGRDDWEVIAVVPDGCECLYDHGRRSPYPGCPATHPPELGGPPAGIPPIEAEIR